MLICFAAGNEGVDRDANGQIDPTSVTPPGTAKNCLTVGACENNRPDKTLTYSQGWPPDFPANPIASEARAEVLKSAELTEFACSLPQIVTGEVLEVSRGVE